MFLTFVSCQKNENIKNKNKIDELVLDSIAKTYDGKIDLYRGFSIDNGKKINYIELNIEKSTTLEDYKYYKHLPPSNIAYILDYFFKQNQLQYDKYKINLQYEDGLRAYEYSSKKLSMIRSCYDKTIRFCNYWKNKDYNQIDLETHHDIFEFDTNDFIKLAKSIDEKKGDIEGFIITGFNFNKTDSGKEFVKTYGILKRGDESSLFTFYINTVDYNVIAMDLKW
ncbi:hypothetical protein [Aquimarina spinulae]|uniref:hypothetical protein n=1 Tax=Aquimarina spinulae TaxID=1192023 RepID=UPI0020C31B50|nr:hypothetical protein [Aquimarina spinulae]